jgi:hypothetical protein
MTAASLLRERRAEPRDAAQFLLTQGQEWNPVRAPHAVAGRIADTARASLPLACAMIHHSQGALLLSLSGGSTSDPGEMMWSLTGATVVARPARRWSVTGRATTCCLPPDHDVRFVVLSRAHGHVLSVQAPDLVEHSRVSNGPEMSRGTVRRGVRVSEKLRGRTAISFDEAAARVHGPFSQEMLAQAAVMGDLLEAAAWYGALTRIADGLVAGSSADEGTGKGPDVILAEADALLSATWAAIREAAHLWDRDGSTTTARHHTARARTLARTCAATLLAGYVPNEHEHARRDPGASESREYLAVWMSRRSWTVDIDIVAGSLRSEGPSW